MPRFSAFRYLLHRLWPTGRFHEPEVVLLLETYAASIGGDRAMRQALPLLRCRWPNLWLEGYLDRWEKLGSLPPDPNSAGPVQESCQVAADPPDVKN